MPSRRVPGIPDHWQNYLLSVIFHMALPLLPLGLELITTGKLEDKSIILIAALYGITVGVASASGLMFGFGVVIGIVFSSVYGVTEAGAKVAALSVGFAKMSMVIVFVAQILERYNRHVVDRHPYFEFMKSKKDQ